MALNELVSAGLIERDNYGDVLWTWAYPSVSREERELFLKKCNLQKETPSGQPFIYSQYRKKWHYIFTQKVTSEALPKVTCLSLVLVSSEFHPEKYETLASLLTKLYVRTGSPAAMLESYLAVVTRGCCNGEENGTFVAKDFERKQAFTTAPMRDVIARFGIEIILVYTAMLLKKRVVLCHSNVEELLNYARALPALVWHRQNWNILYPYVFTDGPEMSELSSARHYVAGFTSPTVYNRPDLYDLFLSINNGEVQVATHAKESLTLGKLHKDLAKFIIQCAEDETKSNQQIIQDICTKTSDLLNNLKSLATPDANGKLVLSLEVLKERKMAASTENFLFNLAAAEGMVAS